MTLTPDQLHILQHSLGCDRYGRGTRGWPQEDEGDGRFGHYRNHYVAYENADLLALVAAGFMRCHAPREITGGMPCYSVTRKGLAAMLAQSPRPPKLTRSQQRYQQWRAEDGSESFKEWLLRTEHNRKVERYGTAEPRRKREAV